MGTRKSLLPPRALGFLPNLEHLIPPVLSLPSLEGSPVTEPLDIYATLCWHWGAQ